PWISICPFALIKTASAVRTETSAAVKPPPTETCSVAGGNALATSWDSTAASMLISGISTISISIRTGPFPVTLPASMGADRTSGPTTSAMPVVTTLMPELGGQRAFKRKGVGNDRPRLSLCRPAGRNFPQVSDPRRLRVVGGRKVDDNEIAL